MSRIRFHRHPRAGSAPVIASLLALSVVLASPLTPGASLGGTAYAASALPSTSATADLTPPIQPQPTTDLKDVAAADLAQARQQAAAAVRDVARLAGEPDQTLQGSLDKVTGTVEDLAGNLRGLADGLFRINGTLVDPALPDLLKGLKPGETVELLLTYDHYPTTEDEERLRELGVRRGSRMNVLPVLFAVVPVEAVDEIAALPGLVSMWQNQQLQYYLKESRALLGVDKVEKDRRFQEQWGEKGRRWNRDTGRYEPVPLPVDGTGVKVAVIDTGIDATHPDLPWGEKVIENRKLFGPGYTWFWIGDPTGVRLGPNVPNTDFSGHGTAMAAAVAGLGEVRPEYAGIARGADLIGLSAGESVWLLYVLDALDWVLTYNLRNPDRPIRVVTNSWGGGPGNVALYKSFLHNPIVVSSRILNEHGVVVVFAAGNREESPWSLNVYSIWPWVISAGSATKSGKLADYAARGIDPLLRDQLPRHAVDGFTRLTTVGKWTFRLIDEIHPDVVAPDAEVVSARASTGTDANLYAPPDPSLGLDAAYYGVYSGTSIAAAQVAGVVALLLSGDRNLTPDQVHEALVTTAQPMPGYGEFEVGAGMVDAYAAVHKVLARKALGVALPYGRGYPAATTAPYSARMRNFGYAIGPIGEPWVEQATYQPLTRSYRLLSRPFPEETVRARFHSELHSLVQGFTGTRSSWLWLYNPTDGERPPRDDEVGAMITSWGEVSRAYAFVYNPVTDNGDPSDKSDHYWFNVRGLLSTTTGTSGADLPSKYSLEVTPLGLTFEDEGFAAWLQGLGADDRRLVRNLVLAGVIDPRGAFDPAAPMPRIAMARAVALLEGVKQYAPEQPTYDDLGPDHPGYTFAESLAGQWDLAGQPQPPPGVAVKKLLGGAAVDPVTGTSLPDLDGTAGTFAPDAPVSTIDLMVTVATLAGLESRAKELARKVTGEAERYIEFTQDSPGGLLRRRVMAQGLTDAQLGYIALAFEKGWLEPVREVMVKHPTLEDLFRWLLGRGAKPEWITALYFDPTTAARTLDIYRWIDGLSARGGWLPRWQGNHPEWYLAN